MHFIAWMKSHYNLYLNYIHSSKYTATLQLNPLPSKRNTFTVLFRSITKALISMSKLTVFVCTKKSKAHEVEGATQDTQSRQISSSLKPQLFLGSLKSTSHSVQVALRRVHNLGFQKQEHRFPVAPVWLHFLQEKKAVYYDSTMSSSQCREPRLGRDDSLVRQL